MGVFDIFKDNPQKLYQQGTEVYDKWFVDQNDPELAKEAYDLFERAEKAGYTGPMPGLAFLLSVADGVPTDDIRALQLFERAALQGIDWAMTSVGIMYENGNGTIENPEKACYWYRKGAEHGHDVAMWEYAKCLYYGYGCEEDEEEAQEWADKALENGYDDKDNEYDEMFGEDEEDEEEEEETDEENEEIDDEGGDEGEDVEIKDPNKAMLIARRNELDGDYQEALRWYIRVLVMGGPQSANDMFYFAAFLFRWRYDKNYPQIMTIEGQMAEAISVNILYILLASENKNTMANYGELLYAISYCFLNGIGCEKNKAESDIFMKWAKEEGFIKPVLWKFSEQ